MEKNFAVVEMTDGQLKVISLDKYLAAQMKIIEECTDGQAHEKLEYWNRIYNYKDQPVRTKFKYHYYNERLKRHLYSNVEDPSTMKALRGRSGYRLVG